MAFSTCFCHYQIPLKIDCSVLTIRPSCNIRMDQRSTFALKGMNTEAFGQRVVGMGSKLSSDWSFMGGSRIIIRPNSGRLLLQRKSFGVCASFSTFHSLAGLVSSQIARSAFTWGTVAVLPFYTLMVLAPKSETTKKSMESSIPYVVLGILYAYLLYLSWTPDTIRLMFASKYWLPELAGIAKMFSTEMTLASAWIHLLAVDLFAARQVFHDGLENKIETRHSVSLCLLFCPIGIITHVITKALNKSFGNTKHGV
ncbi:hypothetical protein F0562_004229 [Nyssa sinensis]|uniref:Neoxanthin synthase n=1 Tax=Nyssa sinensis TaxID=561372 RepID=A0A5J5C0U8_9ASTE|nr:hypothetical protein F0562_004229 [Nyssa sinensis]